MSLEKRLQPFGATINHLAVRWEKARVVLPVFPLLARGRPLTVARIARTAEVSIERLEEALQAGRCDRDSKGRLIDLYGMTLMPTLHRIEVEKRVVYSCCALWAHVIPKLLQRAVLVESVDPVERELVRLSISPDGVDSVKPAGAMATMAVASREAIAADVRKAFCGQVCHFVSRASAGRFADESSSRQVIEVSELNEAASLLLKAFWTASSG